jgi:excisionase family DNA binding protein
MTYTLGQAAKATGKSKPTIQRAIKNGKISAIRNEDGSYEIDPAELHRVFEPLRGAGNDTGDMKQSVPAGDTPQLQAEITVLRERLTSLEFERERERNQLSDQIADLRRRLDAEGEERRKLTALLTDQRHQAEPEAKAAQQVLPWWRRLWSGGS